MTVPDGADNGLAEAPCAAREDCRAGRPKGSQVVRSASPIWGVSAFLGSIGTGQFHRGALRPCLLQKECRDEANREVSRVRRIVGGRC